MTNEIKEDRVRLERLNHLRSLGVDPYPGHTDDKTSVKEALSKPEKARVKIAGRMVAKREMGIRSPLQEAGLTKEEIRSFSYMMKLPTWDKPSFACLASRFPYKTRISAALLKRIEAAESYLRKLHFRQVRVRHHGNLARIEVDKNGLTRLLRFSKKIIKKFQRLGYTYVTADLAGYRTGSMNEPLKKSTLK